jgi:hypothetical protein
MYILPQVQVFQMFRVLPTATVRNLSAFVFGPNYQLFRYGQAAEKALIGLGSYDSTNDTDYSYPSQPAGSTVDQGYVKLYMENVWAKYLQIAAGASTPLVAISDAELNKVRATPIIGAAANGNATANVLMGDTGGYFVNGVSLPEDYVFVPYGGWVSGAWAADGHQVDLTTASGETAKFAYRTSEGMTGVFEIPEDPLIANAKVNGPDGLMFELDPELVYGDNNVRSPLVVRIQNAGATAYFDLSIAWTELKTLVSWDLDSTKPLKVSVIAAGPNAVTWSSTNKTLTINIGTYTLATLKAALEANSDVATYFDISDITGVTTTAPTQAMVVNASAPTDLWGAGLTAMIPDCFRIRVTANPYTFATANGFNRSAQFKARDVQVGDRVSYSIVDDSLVTHTGESRVVALEADMTRAVVDAATLKATNQASQIGTAALSTGADIVEAGADNQREMLGTNTKVFALDAVNADYPGQLSVGILDDTFTVLITVPGLKGVAQATVSNASGTYYRENVRIEDLGSDDGQIYVGKNLYINFDKSAGDADAEFQLGDSYSFEVAAPFAGTPVSKVTSAGVYDGPQDTTYVAEVIRGGVFDRIVNAIPGLQIPSTAVLTPGVTWDDWTGGDVDDEYVIQCTVGGNIATATFQVRSQNADDADDVSFGAALTDVAIGTNGLFAQFDVDDTFTVGDYWIVKVNAARPQLKIYDTAGIDNGAYTIVNDATAIDLGGFGATLEFAANSNTEGGFVTGGGLLKGDVFMVAVEAAAEGPMKVLVLADDLPTSVTPGMTGSDYNFAPNRAAVGLYLFQNSTEVVSKKVQAPPDYNWAASATDVTVFAGIQVQDASWYDTLTDELIYMPVYKADLYAEYRALLPTYSDTIHEITDIGAVATTLGTITPDNPLSQGVYNALSNSGDRSVFYMAVGSDDLNGYLAVLDKASLTDLVYCFAPLSRDGQVQTAVEAHINDLSTETNKRWRIGFFGTEMQTKVAVYDLAKNPAAEEYFATITEDPANAGNYTIVRFFDADGDPSPYTHVLTDVKVGDKLRIKFATDAWGDVDYETYTVSALLTQTSLKLASGPASEVTPRTKAEVWHDYSIAEMAEGVAATSARFANRRIYHVFPSQLGAFGVIETAEFGAAAVAGLCSSVPPQQGLTNIELNGFDDLPMVYSTFNRGQLNAMAAAGTLIIMQDLAGGRIYIRHQVSTATADGDLNTTELSVTKNLDSVSYYFANRLAPYIGRYNVTPQLLDQIRANIQDGLNYLSSFTNVGILGPQLISGEGTAIERVEQHPTLRDHVIAVVNVQLPYPLNVLQLYVVV